MHHFFFTWTYCYRAVLHLNKPPNKGNMLSHIFPVLFFCVTLFQHLPNRCVIPDLWHLEALHGFMACFNLFAPRKLWQQIFIPSVRGPEERHLFRDTQWSQHAWSQSSVTDQCGLRGWTKRSWFTNVLSALRLNTTRFCVTGYVYNVPALCLKGNVWSWTVQMQKI